MYTDSPAHVRVYSLLCGKQHVFIRTMIFIGCQCFYHSPIAKKVIPMILSATVVVIVAVCNPPSTQVGMIFKTIVIVTVPGVDSPLILH